MMMMMMMILLCMSGYVSLYSNFNILIMPFNSIRQVAAPCNVTRARYVVLCVLWCSAMLRDS